MAPAVRTGCMDCPRCGGDLARYVFDDHETVSCERCGYLGVPVEHSGEYREVESWEEALARFRERN